MRAALASSAGLQPPSCKRNRMLTGIVVQQLAHVAAHDGRGDDHLRVKQRMRGVQPVQVPAVTVGPIHHRSDAYAPIQPLLGFGIQVLSFKIAHCPVKALFWLQTRHSRRKTFATQAAAK